MERYSGKISLIGRALEPIHHGEGTAGNTQILRTQRIYSESLGEFVKVPFVSGNSLKHLIRASASSFALDTLGVEDGSLNKQIVHLLFSGGSLGKTGSTVKLDCARDVERLFPALSICGYSASNNMQPSKIKTDHLHLVCMENKYRIPKELIGRPEASRRAAEFRGEEFGTRHEPTRNDHIAQRMLTMEDKLQDQKLLSEAADKMKKGEHREKQKGSAQMLYDFEVVIAGSLWWSGLWFEDMTEREMVVLKTAFEYATRDKANDEGATFFVGAKSSVGFGRMSFTFLGALRQPHTPNYAKSNLPVPSSKALKKEEDERQEYINHLTDNRKDILELLNYIAK